MKNDFVGNENVFEVVGNYPVLDQFDVLYSMMMSGTMYDDYVTGSLFTRTKVADQFVTTFGERGVAFSRLGVSKDALPPLGMSISYASQPWRERAGVVRFVKHMSDAERYYDSLVPRLDKIAENNGRDLQYNTSLGEIVYQIADASFTDEIWIRAFPFESRYSSVERIKRFSYSFFARKDTSNNSLPFPIRKSSIVIYRGGKAFVGSGTLGPGDPVTGLLEADASKMVFGFGDYDYELIGDKQEYAPQFRYDYTSGFVASPLIRGWKYGIYDGMPRYSNAIFRRDRFGQLRDMLEQRQVAAFIDDEQNGPYKVYDYPNESPAITPTNSIPIASSPVSIVTVAFVEPQIINNRLVYVNLAAAASQASNLSTACTSSLPYFDGTARNR